MTGSPPRSPDDIGQDLTVELGAAHARPPQTGSPEAGSPEAGSPEAGSPEAGERLDTQDYWRPGARLDGRVESPRRRLESPGSNRPWWIAGIIVIAALIVAIGLWLTAVWIQSQPDEPETEEPTEDAQGIPTLLTETITI